jgi:stage V sporulation protein B
LADTGWAPEQVRSMYGQLTAMAGAIINLPQVVTQSIGISLVPTIVSAFKTKDSKFLQHNVTLSVRITILIGLPCSVGIMVLAEPIMRLLYPLQLKDAVAAATPLFILGAGIVFLTSIQALTGVLQGVEKQIIPVRNLLIGAGFKVVITYFLTGVRQINILGAALGTVAAYVVAAVLNFRSVRKYTGTVIDWKLALLKPFLSSVSMGAAAFLVYHALMLFTRNSISTIAAVLVGALVYVVMVFVTKSVTEDELAMFPKGTALVKIVQKFKHN